MKVLCSACEAAEASVLCCADEAALCSRCDRDVHAANRLAGKHLRLPLLGPAAANSSSSTAASPSPPPKCDICQVSAWLFLGCGFLDLGLDLGIDFSPAAMAAVVVLQECHAYFFCLEDRALLCRSCDVAVHTANAFVSAHRRFLLTGVRVGQEQDDHSSAAADPPEPSPPPPPPAPTIYGGGGRGGGGFRWDAADTPPAAAAASGLHDWSSVVNEQFGSPAQPLRHAETPVAKRSPRGAAAAAFGGQGGMMDWPLGEFFGGFSDFNAGFGFGDSGTSKADSGKLGGSTDGSPYYRSSSEDDRNDDELFGQVPEIPWSVPELPSPPTASGLHWQRRPAAGHAAGAAPDTVPDISLRQCFPAAASKRRRQC
uniref:B box-type domain-containing protein n=1 Tax=Leersia perrieri TaxID=77586 RepID=A0A0D9WDS0_9ORYZ